MKLIGGNCKVDNSLVRSHMLCDEFEPNEALNKRLDRIASPIHRDLKMRDEMECGNCVYFERIK